MSLTFVDTPANTWTPAAPPWASPGTSSDAIPGGHRASPGTSTYVTPQFWLPEALSQLRMLCLLEPGWNSYGSLSIDASVIAQAVIPLLVKLDAAGFVMPSIIPMANGGLTLEWGIDDKGVEISFTRECVSVLIDDGAEIHEEQHQPTFAGPAVMRGLAAVRGR